MRYFLALYSSTLWFLYISVHKTLAATNCTEKLGCDPAGIGDLEDLFGRILNISVGAAFVALLVVLIIAGIKYITSGGDAKSLGAAHQAIVWGLLGILFMAIAWLILQLIIAFTGVEMLNSFNLRVLPQQ